ncbi:MAG: hypothetical protein PHQ54_05220, partial [Candidatus Omnitrophica bacterium]|nr:hypothetical protein [Candidatus Omnitrophota bacterium]
LKPLSLPGEDFYLISNLKGLNIISNGKRVTGNIGAHSAIKILEKWHDSTQAEFQFEKNKDSLIVRQWCWNIPAVQRWVFTINKNIILWDSELEVENFMSIEEIKTGLILNSCYDKITIGDNTILLPDLNSSWEQIEIPSNTKEVLIGIDNNTLGFPDIVFKSFLSGSIVIQNADKNINGRFVQASITEEKEYPAGKYNIFNAEIKIMPR